jgi:hypothetical protein
MSARPIIAGKTWAIRRAETLHRVCEGIALDLSHDVRPGRAYNRARRLFNQSKVARMRGMTLSISAIRNHYAKWRANPTPSCFEAGWGRPGVCKISPDFARELALRAIQERITIGALYAQLRREVPNLCFSLATLFRILPGAIFRPVFEAQRKLKQAEARALRQIEARFVVRQTLYGRTVEFEEILPRTPISQ